MCGIMVDIQSPTAEIRRGKKERRATIKKKKKQDENIMSASATEGGHKKLKPHLIAFLHTKSSPKRDRVIPTAKGPA